jgi:hypothetical protein
MKKLLRVLRWAFPIGILWFVGSMVYLTARGRMTWYFRVNGVVTVNGESTSGYLHANTTRTLMLVTRTDSGRPKTYLVPLRDNEMIIDCGDWHPIRFLPIPVGGANPPCAGYDTPAKSTDVPTSLTRVTSRRSVEFTTESGKKVKAEF